MNWNNSKAKEWENEKATCILKTLKKVDYRGGGLLMLNVFVFCIWCSKKTTLVVEAIESKKKKDSSEENSRYMLTSNS